MTHQSQSPRTHRRGHPPAGSSLALEYSQRVRTHGVTNCPDPSTGPSAESGFDPNGLGIDPSPTAPGRHDIRPTSPVALVSHAQAYNRRHETNPTLPAVPAGRPAAAPHSVPARPRPTPPPPWVARRPGPVARRRPARSFNPDEGMIN